MPHTTTSARELGAKMMLVFAMFVVLITSCIMLLSIFPSNLKVKTGQQEKLIELRQKAQTMLDSEWVLAQVVVGTHAVETSLISVVEISTGRVISFEISPKDSKWSVVGLRIGSHLKFRYEERPEIISYGSNPPTMAGLLVPIEITPPK